MGCENIDGATVSSFETVAALWGAAACSTSFWGAAASSTTFVALGSSFTYTGSGAGSDLRSGSTDFVTGLTFSLAASLFCTYLPAISWFITSVGSKIFASFVIY
jgi:hypothetical protein